MGLREIREEEGLGLNELARLIDMSPSYLSQLERRGKSNPSKVMMEKIAAALKRPVEEVFFKEKESA